MAFPALPPLFTSPIATAPPLAEAVATPPLPAEAVSVVCMAICPPCVPTKATQPDPWAAMSAGPRLTSFLRPTIKVPPVEGRVNGGVRKPSWFWMHPAICLVLTPIFSLAMDRMGWLESERRQPGREAAQKVAARVENGLVEARIALCQPGGGELVLV